MNKEKPKSFDELERLIKSGDLEVLDSRDMPDGTTWVALCDNRRTYEEGEIYEIYI